MKKFLSLVLALVMTMSLVTVGAGAKDFTDNSKIAYKEAVDVMSAVKVIDGYTDGAFNPANTLTRGAAAKIICNLILGPTTAAALGADAAPFKDVPTNNTFAGYIAYCAQQGIINGYADGTFRPAGTVTGYQFMKMLLGALGYDGATEGFIGANWSVNVAKIGLSIGLDKGNADFSGTKAMTREEACLYGFNALKATMVEYTNNGSNITIGGVTISQDKGKATEMKNYNTMTIKDDGLMQFAEKYFKDLKKLGGSDDFGRPATTWKVKAEKVGTYANAADASYTQKVETGDIYSDLGLSEKIVAGKVTVYTDGVAAATNAKVISKGNDSDKFGGNGVLTEVFYDDTDNSAVVTMVNTYVGTVSKTVAATKSQDAYVQVTIDSAAQPAAAKGTENFTTTMEFADDAYVLYTFAEGDIQSLATAESVEGTVTKVVTGKSIDMGGTTYKNSANMINLASAKSDYTLYLDSYGYTIYVEEQSFVSSDYALVLQTQGDTGFSSNKAKMVFADGTTKNVDTAKNYADGTVKIANNTIVTYKVDDAKVYTLKEVKTSTGARATKQDTTTTTFNMEKGKAAVTIETASEPDTVVYGNSKSVFVVKDKTGSDYKSYTGIIAAPTIKGTTGSVYYYCKNSSVVTVMFVVPGAATVTNDSKDVLYIAGASRSNVIKNGDSEYREYNAVVNGEIKTVMIEEGTTNAPSDKKNYLYSSASYDKYGVIDALTLYKKDGDKDVLSDMGTDKKSGEYTIELTGVSYTVADNAKIYEIDVDGVITAGTIGSVRKDLNDTYKGITVDGQVSYLFLQDVDDNKGDANKPNVDTANYKVNIAGSVITVNYYTGAAMDDLTILGQVQAYMESIGYTKFTVAYTTNSYTITATKGNLSMSFTMSNQAAGIIESVKISVDGTSMLAAKDAKLDTITGVKGKYAVETDKAGTVKTAAAKTGITIADGSAYETGFYKIAAATADYTSTVKGLAAASFALKSGEYAKTGDRIEYVLTLSGTATDAATITFTAGTNSTADGTVVNVAKDTVYAASSTISFFATVGSDDVAAASVVIA